MPIKASCEAVAFEKKALIKERKAGTKWGMGRRPIRPTHLAGTGCSHTGALAGPVPATSLCHVTKLRRLFMVMICLFSDYCYYDEYNSV